MRIVFMGTPQFAVPILQGLLKNRYSVVAVYTQQDKLSGRGRHLVSSPAKRAALECGLEVLQPSNLRDSREVDRLAKLHPEIIVVAGYGMILPQAVLDIPRWGCINVHPSLLPLYRGPSPVSGAILAGEEETGVTIILLDAGMDTGPILAQQRVSIGYHDTTGSLTLRLAELGVELLLEILPRWVEGEINPQPQEQKEATYTRLIGKDDGGIDWQLSARELWLRVRALNPWPACYTRWHGKLLRILKAEPEAGIAEPGRVVMLGGKVVVGTGDGVLALKLLQLEGKRTLYIEEFLRGQRGFVGSRLPS